MTADTAPVRVLIADDVADVRLLVGLFLEASGQFTVVGEAGDGQQAIDLARQCQPDLVVLDLSMPNMDGLEALPEIKQAAPGTRVVVLSGHADPVIREAAREQGADGYLDKSASGDRLVKQLLAILADRQSPNQNSMGNHDGCDATTARAAARLWAYLPRAHGSNHDQEPATAPCRVAKLCPTTRAARIRHDSRVLIALAPPFRPPYQDR
ncbi:MAG TPA: response regulator transcription factor [Mycobacterium sp.]|nr:response regulator transcription factor [Mycobacterium sp.]